MTNITAHRVGLLACRHSHGIILLLPLVFAPPGFALGANDLSGDVQSILARTADAYKNAKTYTDQAVHTLDTNIGDIHITRRMPWNLAFEKPDKINAKAYATRIISDGKQQFIHITLLNQYKVVPATQAPDHEAFFDLPLALMDGDPDMLTPLAMMTADDPLAWLIRFADQVKKLPDADVAGRACYTILLTNSEADTTINVDKQSNLILRRLHVAKTQTRLAARSKGKNASTEILFQDPEINGTLAPDTFAIPTPDDAEKVAEFPFEARMRQRQPASPLAGKKAPDFALKDLNGKEVKLSSFAGKIVVLDFWATWCAPCLHAMPEMQEMHEQYRDKNVVFLGINTDRNAPKGKISNVIQQAGVKFPQLLDGKGIVTGEYGVSNLPTVILIDKAGKIANVQIGAGPAAKRTLTRNIRKLAAQ